MSIRHLITCLFLFALLLTLSPVLAQGPAADSKQYDRSQSRTWTDLNGNQQEAQFAGVLRDQVLLKVGSNTIRIPLNKFSKEDIGWVAEVLRREGKINQLPAQYRDYQPGPAEDPPATTPAAPESASSSKPATTPAPVADRAPLPENTSPPDSSPAMAAPSADESPGESGDAISDYREWEDKSGQKLKAKFQAVIADDVLLKPEQGSIKRVPLKDLSRSDLKLVRDHHEAKGMLQRLPREFRDPIDLNSPEEPSSTPGAGVPAATVSPEDKLRMVRTWKDKDGKELVARFWSLNGDQIMLQDQVRRASYGLASLGPDDLEWFQEAMREAGRLSELPLPYRDPPDRKKSDLELIRFRRTGYYRKWTSFTGKTMVGMYDRFIEDGKVRVVDNNGTPIEFPYVDFSDEDKEYLRERLKREIPGQFFPDNAEVKAPANSPEGSDATVWTDLEGRQLNAKFVRFDRNGTVVVLDSGAGEVPYIRAFLNEDAEKKIKAIVDARNALAKANADAARARFEQQINSGGANVFNPVSNPGMNNPGMNSVSNPGGMGSSPAHADPPNIRDRMPDLAQGPAFQPPEIQMPPVPQLVWTYKCNICGTEFGEESGLKEGDKCPVCSKRSTITRFTVWGVIIGASVVGAMFRRR